MPAEISHMLCGEEALAAEAPDLRDILLGGGRGDLAGRWFRLGCQGPDIFYHNQRTKPSGLHLGALAHRRGYGTLVHGALSAFLSGSLPLRPEREEGPRLAALAWLLGFSTHAALDRALHPYIVCFSGWADPARPGSELRRSCHPFLERILDLALLEELRGRKGAEMDFEALLPLDLRADAQGEPVTGELVTAICVAGLRAAYPRATATDFLLERRVANALTDARWFWRMTNPARTSGNSGADYLAWLDERSGPRSVALIYPESLPRDMDFMNKAGAEWPHPAGDGRVSVAGPRELFAEGLAGARGALRALLDSLAEGRPLPSLLEAIGDQGLSINDSQGQAIAPRVSTPLPLHAVLAQEFGSRLARARMVIEAREAAAREADAREAPPRAGSSADGASD
jgi:hypothetical protein